MVSKKQETVVIQDSIKDSKKDPLENKGNKMAHVQAQPHTHFRLKQKSDREKLLDTINSISNVVGPIVASYDYGRKHNTDIIIRKRGDIKTEPIGKIHLLLFDKPDRYAHDKYYIKLHFFQFENDALFDSVKERVTLFFNSLPDTHESYLGNSIRRNDTHKNDIHKNDIHKNDIHKRNKNKPRRTIKNSLTLYHEN
jgi:hypothetical protein